MKSVKLTLFKVITAILTGGFLIYITHTFQIEWLESYNYGWIYFLTTAIVLIVSNRLEDRLQEPDEYEAYQELKESGRIDYFSD